MARGTRLYMALWTVCYAMDSLSKELGPIQVYTFNTVLISGELVH